MSKKAQGNNILPFVILAIAGMVIFYEPIVGFLGGIGTTPAPTPPGPTVTTTCPVEDVTLGFSAKNVHAAGATIGINARYWIEGEPGGLVNTTTTITASPTDTYEVWFASGDATYYGQYVDGDAALPCKGTFTIGGDLWVQDDSSGVTITVFDEFGERQSGGANNQTIGPGEVKQLKFIIQGTHEEYFGNPDITDMDNALCVEYTLAEIDKVQVTKDGEELTGIGVPEVETVSSTSNKEVAFEIPKTGGSANIEYILIVDADDIQNPAGDIALKLYDVDYFYNDDQGKIDKGYVDEDGTDIGESTEPTATILIE